MLPSLHILGSRQLGGADRFYMRLVRAFHEDSLPVLAVTRAGSPVAKALAEGAIPQVHLPLANHWDGWSAWRIRRLLRGYQPAIVQTYMGRATRLTRVPAELKTVHVARLGGYYKIDGYYRHAHAWVGNTRGICDYLVRSGMPAKRVFQIGNFVPEPSVVSEETREVLYERHALPFEGWILLALGRLIKKKGFADLLKAFYHLPREIEQRPLFLLIAGEGALRKDLQSLSRRLGIEERVRWLGWQDHPDAYYAIADVFICPSSHEPLGNVILEAWNYRLPVVSTATLGALELIENSRNGLLAPCNNPAALAEAIRTLLQASEKERQQLGAAGFATLQRRHSRQAVVQAYLALYRRLVGERG